MIWFKALFDTIGNFFGYMRERMAAKNAPDVKEAQKGQHEVEAVSRVEKAVDKRDIETIRKEIAE